MHFDRGYRTAAARLVRAVLPASARVRRWMGWLQTHRVLLSMMLLNAAVALSGFGKDVAIAGYLGTSAAADAFAATYAIVDTIGNNVFGSAVNVAAAAQLGDWAERLRPQDYTRIAVRMVGLVLCMSVAVAAVLLAVRMPFLSLYARNAAELSGMSSMYLWLLPSVMIYPCYYAVAGAMQALGHFRVSISVPILLNLMVLATSQWAALHRMPLTQGAVVLCASITAGAMLMMVSMAFVWVRWQRKNDIVFQRRTRLDFSIKTLYTGLVRIVISYAFYLGCVQGVGFAERFAASKLGPGSLAALSYAYRVGQVPNWVFISALGVFLLPGFGAAVAQQRMHEVERILRQAVELCWMLCLPISIVFFVFRVPLVQILFERGAFSQHSAALTATFVGGYAIAIVMQGLSALLFRLSAATGRLWLPVVVTGLSCAGNAVFDILMTPHFGPLTIGVGAAAGSGFCSLFLLWYVRRVLGIELRHAPQTVRRFGLANAAVLLMALGALQLFRMPGRLSNGWGGALLLGGVCIVIGLVYLAMLRGRGAVGVTTPR
ncbi:polysaccharide biosynthesis C-terminal domain-containing protein [Alicyclobacillus cycloheptanicus]|uniref:Peptidoglycan biosynthesis protein MviN/MurJ (Putative lipid II flippase) n=1 Tax=Alicyclobacillus cycloheptanicus TaxID=1457 RepID=A0ABT9XII0_9BACL|nr:lipid II flippase MurJ [Alicyclobacillus cycloheptanicus]MDQ0190117.1 peptidoglycan biosynthesis protein MviN/MurJ (putative lipid II flippase) [Alicyclobacillus cycloheptanicus]WDM02089.1 polysaccharide biosynthesis C-terminal domain-containing protein [Alicyclobacillus cycloheptanicus]